MERYKDNEIRYRAAAFNDNLLIFLPATCRRKPCLTSRRELERELAVAFVIDGQVAIGAQKEARVAERKQKWLRSRRSRLAACHEWRLGFRGRAVRAAPRTHFRRNPRGRASSRTVDRHRPVYLTSIRRRSPGSRRTAAGSRRETRRPTLKACPRTSDPSAFLGSFQRVPDALEPTGQGVRPGFLEVCDRCYIEARDNAARPRRL